MGSDFPLPSLAQLSPEQRAVVTSILKTRPSLDGPFLPWLHRPGLASTAEQLGAYLRFDTLLPRQDSELAILCVAALTGCEGEKRIHGPIAIQAGLPSDFVEQLLAGVVPKTVNPRAAVITTVCRELAIEFHLSKATQEQALLLFGAPTLVDLVALVGYYMLVAVTLNVFMPTGSVSGTGPVDM
jgi:4-carboxymuconolactone decarboxylase